MSPVIGRYIRSEIVSTFFAIGILLLIVVFGGLLTDVLSKIARGHFPASLLLPQLALRIPFALTLLLPLAGFLGVLMALSRLYRDAEMAVLASSGFGELSLLRASLRFALPLAAVLLALGVLLSPLAKRLAADLADRANKQLAVAGLEPGRFLELASSGTVVYARTYDEELRQLGDVLIVRERGGELDVVSAEAGEVTLLDGGASQLQLKRGERALIPTDGQGLERAQFDRAELVLPERLQQRRTDPLEIVGAEELLKMSGRPARGEFEARLSPAIQALLLMLIAPLMARSAPRQMRYDRMVIGVVMYLFYSNISSLAKAWYAQGSGPEWLGMLWVHAIMLVVVGAMWWRPWRQARAAATLRRSLVSAA